MTLQIVPSKPTREPLSLRTHATDSVDFLHANLQSLTLGPVTSRVVRRATAKYPVETTRDGAAYVQRRGVALGVPLSHRKLAKSLDDVQEGSVVVVFGLGSGQSARAVRSMCRVPVLVYEPDANVLRSVLSYGPLGLGDIPVVSGLTDLSWYWRKFKGRDLTVRVVVTPGYQEAYGKEVSTFLREVPELLQRTAISRATYNCRAQAWVRDVLDNVHHTLEAPPFVGLANAFAGVPAFVVGAGPSLDKNVAALKHAMTRGIIFATNSGALALQRHGIEPQVVVCIESIDSSDKLKQLSCLERSVRAFSLSAAPETFQVGKGPLLPLHEAVVQIDGPLQQLLGVSGVLTHGSVSTTALSLARIAGCSPIVLVGQDLAYTDGATYASGTGYETSAATVDEAEGRVSVQWNAETRRVHGTGQGSLPNWERLVTVPRWGGVGVVNSTVSFSSVRQWLEGMATLLADAPDRPRLVNATEGGSSIAGFEEVRLADIVASLPERLGLSPQDIALRANEGFQPLSEEHLGNWLMHWASMTRAIELSARRCRRIASYARRAMKTGGSTSVVSAYAKLDVAERNLRAAVRECPLVDAWSHGAVDRAIGIAPAAEADAQARALHAMGRSVRVATAVERSAKELVDYLRETRRRIALRP